MHSVIRHPIVELSLTAWLLPLMDLTVIYNPQTGAEIEIKASRQPKFRAGKQLKDALNESA